MGTCYKGQIFKGYIAQIPGVDGPIRWEYRGLWPEARVQYGRDLERFTTPDEQEAYILATLATLLVKWDLKYPDNHPEPDKRGQIVKIDPDVIKSDVMVHVRNRIMAISTWQAYGDVDPQLKIDEQVKAVKDRAENKTVADLFAKLDEANVKN
jgi:hypothetical protein